MTSLIDHYMALTKQAVEREARVTTCYCGWTGHCNCDPRAIPEGGSPSLSDRLEMLGGPLPTQAPVEPPAMQDVRQHPDAHTHLTTDSLERKAVPLAAGCLDYFPDALADVARLSKIGNDKHNPGEPLHWSREKSSDHADCILRHMLDRGTVDTDGLLHDTKVAWRALAQLQLAIEKRRALDVSY